MKRSLVALALLGSLGLNVMLLLRGRPPAGPPRECPAMPVTRAPAASLFSLPSVTAAPTLSPSVAAARAPVPRAAVDDALEQEVLCTVAEEKLRAQWRGDREAITESLRRSLADRAGQERDVRENATRLATLLELDPAQTVRFAERYRERRLARIGEALGAVEPTPPVYAAILRAVQGLISDEDALARELAGEQGRERLRAAELEGRTTILAIGAALADAPFAGVRW